MSSHHGARRLLFLPVMALAVSLLSLACGASPEATSTPDVRSDPTEVADDGAGAAASTFDFPTGEPVLVAAGYTHPSDHVATTGAYLPANGKPTVVFVDAIW